MHCKLTLRKGTHETIRTIIGIKDMDMWYFEKVNDTYKKSKCQDS